MRALQMEQAQRRTAGSAAPPAMLLGKAGAVGSWRGSEWTLGPLNRLGGLRSLELRLVGAKEEAEEENKDCKGRRMQQRDGLDAQPSHHETEVDLDSGSGGPLEASQRQRNLEVGQSALLASLRDLSPPGSGGSSNQGLPLTLYELVVHLLRISPEMGDEGDVSESDGSLGSGSNAVIHDGSDNDPSDEGDNAGDGATGSEDGGADSGDGLAGSEASDFGDVEIDHGSVFSEEDDKKRVGTNGHCEGSGSVPLRPPIGHSGGPDTDASSCVDIRPVAHFPSTASALNAAAAGAKPAISAVVSAVCSLPGLRCLRLTNCVLSSRDLSALCRGLPDLQTLAAVGRVCTVGWHCALLQFPPQL